jgi:hypothetical protein
VKRYVVRPCDNLGTLSDAKRDRTWSVVDRSTGKVVADRDVRKDARDLAKEMNNEQIDEKGAA